MTNTITVNGIIKGARSHFINEDVARRQHMLYQESIMGAGVLNARDIDAAMAFMRYLKTYCERGDAAMYDAYIRGNTNMSHVAMTKKVQVGIRAVDLFNTEVCLLMELYDAQVVHFGVLSQILLPR